MKVIGQIFRRSRRHACVALALGFLTACASVPPVPPSEIETRADALTLPYRLSDAGHLIIELSVNGQPAQPFIIDSGANISAIYEDHAEGLGLASTGKSVTVTGIVASGERPVADDVTFQLGSTSFTQEQTVLLDDTSTHNEAVGLLGVDILGGFAVVFNAENQRATFLPSHSTARETFAGWDRIPLKNRVGSYDDQGLYFSEIRLVGEERPVLIDTGSDLNIINWPLATLDPKIERMHRKIRTRESFQGAIDSADLRTETVFFDVQLGPHNWPKVDITVIEFDIVTTIAPVDQPMMIAGAGMFTPSTFAFDFGGNAIYIYTETPPS